MKEWLTGRNPVYESLRANRRHFFRLLVAKGIEHSGHINDIFTLARARKLQIEEVQRSQIDSFATNHQGIALQTSTYPMVTIDDILAYSASTGEPMFVSGSR